jgi:eukaryotic-like serine/threonine-protein kinase
MKPTTVFCTQCGAANPSQAKFCFSCGQEVREHVQTEQPGQLKPGDMLKQRYKVLSQIGQGGFGAVYKAEDEELGQRLLAVKEMSQQSLNSQEIGASVGAFKREALMLARLRHQHLPRIYDHFSENERWYLLMDYIEGETLEDRFEKSRDGSLPLVMALNIAEQLCDVLEYLHTRQPPIIFRDLKPANVILTPEGHLFLIDFGIARHFKPGQAKDTIAFGSPGYAPPEQYGKAQTTPRADIYSLGAILHQMLTGDDPSLSPFRFSPLATKDQDLRQLVAQMLEINEKDRPKSIAEVKLRLQLLKDQPIGSGDLKTSLVLPAVPTVQKAPAHPVPSSSPTPVLIHEHHYGVVRAVGWSPDSHYAASATDAIIRVWDTQTGRNIASYREHVGTIRHMAWSPSGMRIASISEENKIRIWDASTGKAIGVYPANPGFEGGNARVLSWSHDGHLLAVAGKGYIHIWDVDKGEVIARLKRRLNKCTSLSWAPNGASLAAAYDNKVLVWQPANGKKVSIYHYHAQINVVAWSPDGTYLASGGYDQAVHVWDVLHQRLIVVYPSHAQPVCAISWSPDSRRIASGAFAANVNVWDALTGWGITSYYAHTGMALAVAWSPDGNAILTGGSDRRVCIWRAP